MYVHSLQHALSMCMLRSLCLKAIRVRVGLKNIDNSKSSVIDTTIHKVLVKKSLKINAAVKIIRTVQHLY